MRHFAAAGVTVAGVDLETPRLRLRAVRDDDVPSLYAIQSDREAMRFTHVSPSLEEYAERLRTYEASRSRLGFAPWTLEDNETGRILGWGGLNVDPFEPGWGVEVGYFLDRAVWGRGLATELVRASLEHGFARLSLPAVGAFAMPENAVSIRVLEKCGFALVRFEPRLARNRYTVDRAAWERRGKCFFEI